MNQMHELSRRFPNSLIKEAAPGRYGDYVSHSTVTERLLSIVGPFTFEVKEVIRGDAPAVIGKDGTAENPTYPARSNAVVGCIAEMRVSVDGKVVAIAEVGDVDEPAMNHDGANLKNAASDAIKRCAMRIGLGLHLWSQELYFLDKQLDKELQDEASATVVDELNAEVVQ
jgi:hypothetical protein